MFKILTENMFVSPQIDVAAVADAARHGVTLIINNRPDGESADQAPGADIAAAARAVGIAYVAIPVTQAGFSMPQVEEMAAAINGAGGSVLAYCRSGTRSTNLWALAQASGGASADSLTHAAANAGYDLSPLRAMIDMLGQRA
ncbi:MAG: TIGR01244 family sulfur transferase [Pseudomonadota bacterium]